MKLIVQQKKLKNGNSATRDGKRIVVYSDRSTISDDEYPTKAKARQMLGSMQ